MSLSNVFENDLLKLILNATPIPNLADNAAASPLASLFMSLHTADPGEAGDQTTSEANYTGYARKAIVRTTSGWTAATTGSSSNVATVTFDPATAGNNTITHAAIGTALTGTGKILTKAALNSPLPVAAGITPQFGPGVIVFSFE